MIARDGLKPKEKAKERLLKLELLQNDRLQAVKYYKAKADKRRDKFNKQLTPKGIQEGHLVLRCDSRYDHNKGGKFDLRWDGPFQVLHKFGNGSYQLQDMDGRIHHTRVNGWRLKPYFSRIQEEATTYEEEAEPQGIG